MQYVCFVYEECVWQGRIIFIIAMSDWLAWKRDITSPLSCHILYKEEEGEEKGEEKGDEEEAEGGEEELEEEGEEDG